MKFQRERLSGLFKKVFLCIDSFKIFIAAIAKSSYFAFSIILFFSIFFSVFSKPAYALSISQDEFAKSQISPLNSTKSFLNILNSAASKQPIISQSKGIPLNADLAINQNFIAHKNVENEAAIFNSNRDYNLLKNIELPDCNIALTKNHQNVQNIVNENESFKFPIRYMGSAAARQFFDSFSGVFLANIFTAAMQTDGKILFSQINRSPFYKIWLNINYAHLEFHRHNQTLGIFDMHALGVSFGKDLAASPLFRLGVFADLYSKKFKQEKNIGSLANSSGGLYANVHLGGFNIWTLLGIKYAQGRAMRYVKMDRPYYPVSEISFMGFMGTLGFDYMFVAADKVFLKYMIGPFISIDFNQIKTKEILETQGANTNLHLPPHTLHQSVLKSGIEFRQHSLIHQVFANIFVGKNLNSNNVFKFIAYDGNAFNIESDQSYKVFYGGQIGVNFSVSQDTIIGMQISLEINENLKSHNASLNLRYKIPKRRFFVQPYAPEITFLGDSAIFSANNKRNLEFFAQTLSKSMQDFRNVQIIIKVNRSDDPISSAANKLTQERVEEIIKILSQNGIARGKITVIPKIKTLKRKMKVRVEF
jgi:hypothetical protein